MHRVLHRDCATLQIDLALLPTDQDVEVKAKVTGQHVLESKVLGDRSKVRRRTALVVMARNA